jgi:hypothetical protein
MQAGPVATRPLHHNARRPSILFAISWPWQCSDSPGRGVQAVERPLHAVALGPRRARRQPPRTTPSARNACWLTLPRADCRIDATAGVKGSARGRGAGPTREMVERRRFQVGPPEGGTSHPRAGAVPRVGCSPNERALIQLGRSVSLPSQAATSAGVGGSAHDSPCRCWQSLTTLRVRSTIVSMGPIGVAASSFSCRHPASIASRVATAIS